MCLGTFVHEIRLCQDRQCSVPTRIGIFGHLDDFLRSYVHISRDDSSDSVSDSGCTESRDTNRIMLRSF